MLNPETQTLYHFDSMTVMGKLP